MPEPCWQLRLLRHVGTLQAHEVLALNPWSSPNALCPAHRAGLYLCIGDPFLPGDGGSAWAIMVVWAAAQIGTLLAEAVRDEECLRNLVEAIIDLFRCP